MTMGCLYTKRKYLSVCVWKADSKPKWPYVLLKFKSNLKPDRSSTFPLPMGELTWRGDTSRTHGVRPPGSQKSWHSPLYVTPLPSGCLDSSHCAGSCRSSQLLPPNDYPSRRHLPQFWPMSLSSLFFSPSVSSFKTSASVTLHSMNSSTPSPMPVDIKLAPFYQWWLELFFPNLSHSETYL